MSILQHLETHMGKIRRGWGERDSPDRIQVVEFEDQPTEGVTTYSTAGLSNYILPLIEGNTVRQELVFSAYRRFDSEQIASFLYTFAEHLLRTNRALLRGDVVGPSTSIVFGTLLNSIYCAIPVLFEDSFAVYSETMPPTVLVWIIPIHEEEVNFVRANDWKEFEELLETNNPDLWDLHRKSLI